MFRTMAKDTGCIEELCDFEDGDEGEEIKIKDGEDTEVEPIKIASDPGKPTERQVAEHRLTHIPYRSWCRWCVLGRGRGLQHRACLGSVIPIIGVDYFFLTERGVQLKEELDMSAEEVSAARARGDIAKCLIVRCYASKAVFGHVVPCKGLDEDGLVVDMLLQDLEWLGHTRIIVKADNEPSIQALARRAVELAKIEIRELDQVSREDPAAYDSMANGGTEVGVKLIRGLFRTVKLCIEQRVDKRIPVDHPFIAWMMEHASLLLNAMVRGTDGLTAWMRVRGRSFGQPLVGLGEMVLYKHPIKGPRHDPEGNVGAQGGEGIFIGFNRNNHTFTISLTDGQLVAARSITRRPESERWSPEAMAGVRVMPGERRQRAQRERIRFEDGASDTRPTADAARPKPVRRMRIDKEDLDKHGYDSSCPQCQHIIKYGRARPGGQHTHECRKKVMEAMSRTEAGRERLRINEERINKSMAEQIEAADRQPPVEPQQAHHHPDPPRGFLERDREDAAAQGVPAGQARGSTPPQPESTDSPTQHDHYSPSPESQESKGDSRTARGSDHRRRGVRGAMVVPAEEAHPAETPTAGNKVLESSQELPHESSANQGDENMEDASGNDVEMEFVGNVAPSQGLGSLEPSFDDSISSMLLAQIGYSGKAYRREKATAVRRIVSEIYSPPRVTELIRELRPKHLMAGFALDLTVIDEDGEPWDFTNAAKRNKARRIVREQRPYVLIGSPMCKSFSTWQRLNMARSNNVEAMQRARVEATMHLDFVASLYEDQADGGRYFLHEHPRFAESWEVPTMARLLARDDVERVHGDQCQFGAEIKTGRDRGDPLKKPTGFMTNSPHIAKVLNVQCRGQGGECSRASGGKHRLCSGRHAREAAKYPRALCRAILKGIRDQLRADDLLKNGCYGIQAPDDEAEIEKNLRGPAQGYSGAYKDDLTGQVLRDDLVRAARAQELAYFYAKKVWIKIPKSQARRKGTRAPVSVRWVDVNKGDDLNPNYRSRLVARQLKATDFSGKNYFAPAPPLEALKTVISMSMTRAGDHRPDWNPDSPTRVQISLVDVKRAYFNAQIHPDEPETLVQLPSEDPDSDSMCARLLRHMYGTRAAADGWQEEYSTRLVDLGFVQGSASPNVFRHHERQITTSVHGDDFTSSGPANQLDWLETALAEHYELTIAPRLGPGPGDAKEGRVLNRVIRWRETSIEYECDPRQVERLIAECGLDGAKPVATPGVKATFKELEEENTELPQHLVTAFRGAAARGNYIAADRLDVQFACKEVCRWMSRPSNHAWKSLKRVCRYLAGAPRLVYSFEQQEVDHVDVYVDTDWAGCPLTRKSTSGGCVLLGKHAVKHWSSTQTSVSLSSGEAEFAGVIRGAGQGLGYQALLRDVGVELPLRVWTDSSAAVGICSRQGLGKLRHLDTHTLWIQQAVRTQRVDLRKVDGECNPADLLTKHSLSRQRLETLIALYGCRYLGGRAESAPQVRKGASTKMTMAGADQEISGTYNGPDEVKTGQGLAPEWSKFPAKSGVQDDMSRELVEFPEKGGVQDSMRALMPHLQYTAEELDQLHPSLVPPEDEHMDDLIDDDQDVVYQKGLRIAQEIQEETSAQGRRRRPLEAAGNTSAGTGYTGCAHYTETSACQKSETAAAKVDHELDALPKEECLDLAPLSTLLPSLPPLLPPPRRRRLEELAEVSLKPTVLPSVRRTPNATLDGSLAQAFESARK